MPRNAKEAMIFTFMMCGLMVVGMSTWNLWLAHQLSWQHLALGLFPGFAVAFIADVVIVGPLAKKIAFAILDKLEHHEKRVIKIVTISSCMVLGMVTIMSLYGVIMSGNGITLANYLKTWISNFVIALPYNLLIVGPISRFILGKVQKPLPGEDKVEDFEDDEELPTII